MLYIFLFYMMINDHIMDYIILQSSYKIHYMIYIFVILFYDDNAS